MATTVNIFNLLKSFALHQNSAFINYNEFAEYMRRFAQKHLPEHPELNVYLGQNQEILQKNILTLKDQKKIFFNNENTDYSTIIVPAFYSEKYTAKYIEIENNVSIPYPMLSDLPKQFPTYAIERRNASDFVVELLSKKIKPDPNILYGIIIPKDLPVIVIPGSIDGNTLFDVALSKIRNMLRKEEYHDYFMKKLTISNPGKEITAKNFFIQFVARPADALEALKTSGESFYFWSQLCFFIRQDYDKVKDYTQEDISILQSVYITEYAIAYFKNMAQKNQQRIAALKLLNHILGKPPYFFSKETIARFTDDKGVPLLGQYTQDDLNKYLKAQTTTSEGANLPSLLIFTAENKHVYYIQKNKVLPLIARLSGDAREAVKKQITKEWTELYKRFETLPEMSEQKAFERKLEQEVRTLSPILYALLNSNFLSLIHYETRTDESSPSSKINLYSNGSLIPYSELLMLRRQELVSEIKIMLPFWYTMPIISWIAALILKPSRRDKARQKKLKEKKQSLNEKLLEDEIKQQKPKRADAKSELRKAARNLEAQMVPEGSTLDRELSAYIHQWNRIINKSAAMDLTEDVNSLIRDYMRRTIRTLHGSTFTMDRIQHLAETLAKSSALSKIRDQDQLIMYIELYIVKLVKNL